jgi:hypothetical protein
MQSDFSSMGACGGVAAQRIVFIVLSSSAHVGRARRAISTTVTARLLLIGRRTTQAVEKSSAAG